MSESSVNMESVSENWKEVFFKEASKGDHYKVIVKSKYDEIVQDVLRAKLSSEKKSAQQFRRLRRFDVIEINDTNKLIAKCKDDAALKYYVPLEDMYDLLQKAHVSTGHGARDRLLKETSMKYANVTRELVNLFLSMCQSCQQKKIKRRRGLVSKPILLEEMNTRC
ncbi:KRAB-A domain-containing protein 2-like [Trichogramma pretiosum]|uniref:KRAB-A domain-containing protein 2-like n=1 Tax=Trichogramma pretiosum TaxID=7493 RepID=UPI0006C9B845|nr:KRAB-A domain-containing protein 2-like [Trichogramma pretiosum]